jgi:hypothetical protein
MEPLISETRALTNDMLVGINKNGDGVIKPVGGEDRADSAYESTYRMADMLLLRGARRIPRSLSTSQANH